MLCSFQPMIIVYDKAVHSYFMYAACSGNILLWYMPSTELRIHESRQPAVAVFSCVTCRSILLCYVPSRNFVVMRMGFVKFWVMNTRCRAENLEMRLTSESSWNQTDVKMNGTQCISLHQLRLKQSCLQLSAVQ
jgi:hypothetical protein